MNEESGGSGVTGRTSGGVIACDMIFLHDHIAEIEIGAFAEEYGVTQRIRFNIELDVPRFSMERADDVESIVSYDLIIEAIDALAAGPRFKLLEAFAESLAEVLLSEPRVSRAVIRMEKLDRVSGSLGIRIERRSGGIV